jgi:hypothetical protein
MIAGLRNICNPAYVYFVISIILLLVMFLQNLNNVDVYCLGSYECSVSNVNMIFLIKFIYILFWTWILNLMCKSGVTPLAWILVLLPIVLFFVISSVLFIS